MRSIISEKKDMYDLIPIIENWFIEKAYNVTVIANRIDAKKDQVAITLFLDNYPSGCLIKVYSTEEFFVNLKKYLADEFTYGDLRFAMASYHWDQSKRDER